MSSAEAGGFNKLSGGGIEKNKGILSSMVSVDKPTPRGKEAKTEPSFLEGLEKGPLVGLMSDLSPAQIERVNLKIIETHGLLPGDVEEITDVHKAVEISDAIKDYLSGIKDNRVADTPETKAKAKAIAGMLRPLN